MEKIYIKTGELMYCNGCILQMTDATNVKLLSIEEELYYGKSIVRRDENGYYVEK